MSHQPPSRLGWRKTGSTLLCGGCKKQLERQHWCGQCRLQPYCSRECQVADWANHKCHCISKTQEVATALKKSMVNMSLELDIMEFHMWVEYARLVSENKPTEDYVFVINMYANQQELAAKVASGPYIISGPYIKNKRLKVMLLRDLVKNEKDCERLRQKNVIAVAMMHPAGTIFTDDCELKDDVLEQKKNQVRRRIDIIHIPHNPSLTFNKFCDCYRNNESRKKMQKYQTIVSQEKPNKQKTLENVYMMWSNDDIFV